jgi:hypothetical protein
MTRTRFAPLLLLAAMHPLVAGCDRWALSVNGDGLLFISVIGDGDDHGGFRIRTRDGGGTARIAPVPSSGNLRLEGVAAGPFELTLLAPEECRVAAPNPRTLTVSADQPVNVGFEVHCR